MAPRQGRVGPKQYRARDAIDGCGSCCTWCGPGHELSPEHTILNKNINFEEQKYEVLSKSMLNSLNLGKVHMIVLHFKLGSGQSYILIEGCDTVEVTASDIHNF